MLQDIVQALLRNAFKAVYGAPVAEAKDVSFSEMSEVRTPFGPALRLGGLVLHSSFAVAKIEVTHKADAAIVHLKLTPAEPGLSGSFLLDVPFRPDTQRVLFGRELKPIWAERESKVGLCSSLKV
jgi:hypothetical protein